jgi:phosphoribosylformylglycinamidine cyclo-ligase
VSKTTYKSSGVDIDAGKHFVKLIKPHVDSTRNKFSNTGLGGFSGTFSLPKNLKNALLVSATDGVGTKLKLAIDSGILDTVGIDLVAMSVNDLITCGAKPMFFLDYLATSRLIPEKHVDVVKGIVNGCRQSGCVLLGGETAEMPGFYSKNDFDLAGFAVGIIEKDKYIDGKSVRSGDAVIGLKSSGLHSNGYSLARKVLFDKGKLKPHSKPKGFRRTLYRELLEPTKIYVNTVMDLTQKYEIKAIAHITGGGLLENIPRVLPKGYKVIIDSGSWKRPGIMSLIKETGNIDETEMYRTFNCGIGLVLITPDNQKNRVLKRLEKLNQKAFLIGEVTKSKKVLNSVEIL